MNVADSHNLFLMYPSKKYHLLSTALLLCAAGFANAQTPGGSTVQDTPGIALVKPQAWSKESEVRIVEFSTFVDRRAASNAAAGYYEFQTPSGQKVQHDSSKVLRVIVYPDANRIPTLVQQTDRDKIEEAFKEIQALTVRFPNTKTYLQPRLATFSELLTRFDGGEVKVDGQWIPRRQFLDKQAAGLVDILKVEIERANPPGSFNLEDDPKYLELRSMAKDSPRAKALADQMTALHERILRAEKRRQVLKKLETPSVPLDEGRVLVTELEALEPNEDPSSILFLGHWKAGTKKLKELTETAEALTGEIEPQLAPVKEFSAAPELTAETQTKAADLLESNKAFDASRAPAQLKSANLKAESVDVVANGFVALVPLIKASQYLEAKEILDGMAPRADQVGPESVRVIAELQKVAAARIEQFTRVRDEAKALVDAGKPDEAVVKYEEALTIIADPGISRAIEEIKNPPAPTP
ncbi:MAG: hypothetical protein WEB60_08800 [Terrimicrobiaceae bacterium]